MHRLNLSYESVMKKEDYAQKLKASLIPDEHKKPYKHPQTPADLLKYREVTTKDMQIEKKHEFAYCEFTVAKQPLLDVGFTIHLICEDKSKIFFISKFFFRWSPNSNHNPRPVQVLWYHILLNWVEIRDSESLLQTRNGCLLVFNSEWQVEFDIPKAQNSWWKQTDPRARNLNRRLY